MENTRSPHPRPVHTHVENIQQTLHTAIRPFDLYKQFDLNGSDQMKQQSCFSEKSQTESAVCEPWQGFFLLDQCLFIHRFIWWAAVNVSQLIKVPKIIHKNRTELLFKVHVWDETVYQGFLPNVLYSQHTGKAPLPEFICHSSRLIKLNPSIHPSIRFQYLDKWNSEEEEADGKQHHLRLDLSPVQFFSTAVWIPTCEQQVDMSS